MQASLRPPLPPRGRRAAVGEGAGGDARRRAAPRTARALPDPQRHHRQLLAALPEGSPLTHAVIAGLTTLHVLHRWHFRGVIDAADLAPVRMAIGQVDAASPFAPPLAAALDRITPLLAGDEVWGDAQATTARADAASSVGAYALALEGAGLPGAARDAYRLMRALGETVMVYGEPRGRALANVGGFGWARVALADGALDGSERMYLALRDEAVLAGDLRGHAKATLGLAAVREGEGRLGEADHLVRDALDIIGVPRAQDDARVALVVIGMRALTRTRMARGDWAGAARAFSTGGLFASPGHEQDLLLAGLGASLLHLGARRAAREALECLATTARSGEVRALVDEALLGMDADRRRGMLTLASPGRPGKGRAEHVVAGPADDDAWMAIVRHVVARRESAARGRGD